MSLQERFAVLREEERQRVPPFAIASRASRPHLSWRVAAAFAVVVVIVAAVVARSHRNTFTRDDRAAARAIAAWHPPTDFLLRMPSTGVPR